MGVEGEAFQLEDFFFFFFYLRWNLAAVQCF